MGVPIPPTLAATGIESANAIRPLPEVGRVANTGERMVSIIAAVAVFDINIEQMAVTTIKPKSTIGDFVPKGLRIALAIPASNLYLLAIIANTNPPIKSIMIGSANVAIISL